MREDYLYIVITLLCVILCCYAVCRIRSPRPIRRDLLIACCVCVAICVIYVFGSVAFLSSYAKANKRPPGWLEPAFVPMDWACHSETFNNFIHWQFLHLYGIETRSY